MVCRARAGISCSGSCAETVTVRSRDVCVRVACASGFLRVPWTGEKKICFTGSKMLVAFGMHGSMFRFAPVMESLPSNIAARTSPCPRIRALVQLGLAWAGLWAFRHPSCVEGRCFVGLGSCRGFKIPQQRILAAPENRPA